jgi:hypothetical protein
VTRAKFLACFAQLPQATVVMEACSSAHYWARGNASNHNGDPLVGRGT